ncbi:MAG: restriction endonuclease subunit S [Candidatus Omnitrophica bacterium]|nr:restriction endonuclease subunit S [Candidatus Omnitrophota bacterium]MBU0897258.1 restriction endonuclease subunit S [Candidatus Omnitrophota bacterium]MBU1134000.1 restriction endonuclease subunit S [Candidatus Omnitrophota bacterium]MBU1367386.1 restriction endonuclease subunit S [Candidatus Omnitrophota bacterium]MBU1523241.1 restriction endonuclease subunit S [Candidatus Omnitrophota bacterium]
MKKNSEINGFKETEIGLIPSDWEVVNIDSFVKFQRGSEPGRSNYNKEMKGVRFLRVVDVSGSREDEIYTTVENIRFCTEKDILITLDGSPGIIRKGLSGAYSSGIRKIVFTNKDLNQDYTYFVLQNDFVKKIIEKYTTGITIKHSSKAIPYIKIPLPSLPEQQKIAVVLLKIQQAIEQQEKIIQTTKELKKSLTNKFFTEGLHGEEQKKTEIGLIPKSWEVKKLGDIALIERGKFTHRPRNEPKFYGGKIPFIQTGDIANSDGRITSYTQTLNELGLSISKIFPKGTIVITIAANIGDTAILTFDSAFPDSIIGITPHDNVLNIYLEYYLRTQKDKMNMMAPRGTQKNINIQFLKPWFVPIAPKNEQNEIANTLSSIDKKLSQAESRKQTLQSLFKTMLNQLMTGRVRIKDLDIKVN